MKRDEPACISSLRFNSATTSGRLNNGLPLLVPKVLVPPLSNVLGLVVVDVERGLVLGDLAESTRVSSSILLRVFPGCVASACFAIFVGVPSCILDLVCTAELHSAKDVGLSEEGQG